MNLRLRRTLSSFLAFVMLCSCMVVANVGSVFAADITSSFSYSAEDFVENTTTFGNQDIVSPNPDDIKVSGEFAFQAYGTRAENETLINNTNKTFEYELEAGGNRDLSFIAGADGIVTVYGYTTRDDRFFEINSVSVGIEKMPLYTVSAIETNVSAGDTFSLRCTGTVVFLGIDYTVNGGSVTPPEEPEPGGTVTLTETIDLAGINSGSVSSETAAGNFKLLPSTGSKISVADESDGVTVNGTTVTKYVSLTGSGNTDGDAIVVNAKEAGNLYIWARSTGTVQRTLVVDNKTVRTNNTVSANSGEITMIKVAIEANQDYYIYSAGSGINIYLIGTDVALNTPEATTPEPQPPVDTAVQVIPDQTENDETGVITLEYIFTDKTGNLVNVIEEKADTSAFATVGNLQDTGEVDENGKPIEETEEDVYNRGDAKDTYITLSSKGAKLIDNSTTYTTRLAIPFIEDAGTTTVTGTITLDDDASNANSWSIIDMGPVALRYDEDTSGNHILFLYDPETDQQIGDAMTCSLTSGSVIGFSLAMDLDNNKATADITVGDSSLTMTGDVSTDAEGNSEAMDWIVFGTGGSSTNRDFTVSDLTITDTNGASIIGINGTSPEDGGYSFVENDTANDPVNVALLRRGFLYYIVSVVSKEAVESNDYSAVVQNVLAPLTEGSTGEREVYNELASSNEVYEGIEVNGTVYTATDFGGQAGDYLFASYIENDQRMTIIDMRNNILERVATALTPNTDVAA